MGVRWGDSKPGQRDRCVGVAGERQRPGEGLVEHQPQGVQVGAPINLSALHLFRGKVGGRAHQCAFACQPVACGGLGDAEIGDLHPSIPTQQDVGRFDVTVNEVGSVSGGKGIADRGTDMQCVVGAEALVTVEVLAQRGSVDQLHHDRLDPVLRNGVED